MGLNTSSRSFLQGLPGCQAPLFKALTCPRKPLGSVFTVLLNILVSVKFLSKKTEKGKPINTEKKGNKEKNDT